MNKIKKITTSIILSSLAFQAYATHSTIVGPGASSCINWTDARKVDGRLAGEYVSWVKGFLSGINITNYYSTDILEDSGDLEEYFAWLDHYCRQNPREPIATAADNLMHDLTARKKNPQ